MRGALLKSLLSWAEPIPDHPLHCGCALGNCSRKGSHKGSPPIFGGSSPRGCSRLRCSPLVQEALLRAAGPRPAGLVQPQHMLGAHAQPVSVPIAQAVPAPIDGQGVVMGVCQAQVVGGVVGGVPVMAGECSTPVNGAAPGTCSAIQLTQPAYATTPGYPTAAGYPAQPYPAQPYPVQPYSAQPASIPTTTAQPVASDPFPSSSAGSYPFPSSSAGSSSLGVNPKA